MTSTTIPLPDAAPTTEARGRGLVAQRSGGYCEVCGRKPAAHWHTRKSMLHGGTWSPANGLHVCDPCEARLTRTGPAAARFYRLGWCVLPGRDPALVPVQINHGHRVGRYLLDHDGDYSAYPLTDEAI